MAWMPGVKLPPVVPTRSSGRPPATLNSWKEHNGRLPAVAVVVVMVVVGVGGDPKGPASPFLSTNGGMVWLRRRFRRGRSLLRFREVHAAGKGTQTSGGGSHRGRVGGGEGTHSRG